MQTSCSQFVALYKASTELALPPHPCVKRLGIERQRCANQCLRLLLARKRPRRQLHQRAVHQPNNAASAKRPSRAAVRLQTLKKWRLRRAPRASADQSERYLANRLPARTPSSGCARRRRGGRGQGRTGASSATRAHLAGARRVGVGRRVACCLPPCEDDDGRVDAANAQPVAPSRSCDERHSRKGRRARRSAWRCSCPRQHRDLKLSATPGGTVIGSAAPAASRGRGTRSATTTCHGDAALLRRPGVVVS